MYMGPNTAQEHDVHGKYILDIIHVQCDPLSLTLPQHSMLMMNIITGKGTCMSIYNIYMQFKSADTASIL